MTVMRFFLILVLLVTMHLALVFSSLVHRLMMLRIMAGMLQKRQLPEAYRQIGLLGR